MNKKITVLNGYNKKMYCIVDAELDLSKQLEKIMDAGSHGVGVEVTDKHIALRDYFHAENIFVYPIVSIEETELELSLKWNEI